MENGVTSLKAELLLAEITAPATGAGQIALYAKDIGGQPELFAREESSGDEVQITSGGAVNVGFSALETTDASQVGGSTTTLVEETEYQAAVDGFVYINAEIASGTSSALTISGQIGVTSGALTTYTSNWIPDTAGIRRTGLLMPVAKDEYWKVDIDDDAHIQTIAFRPLS